MIHLQASSRFRDAIRQHGRDTAALKPAVAESIATWEAIVTAPAAGEPDDQREAQAAAAFIRRRDGQREQLDRLVDAMARGKAMADAVQTRVEQATAEIARLDALIDQLEGRLASARMTEADLETRMAAIRRGVERLPEQPPERQREVITALVADVSLAAGQPLRLRVWPSPDAELQETLKTETPVREFVRVSAVVGPQGFEPR